MTLSFKDLREIKDRLPSGSMARIAGELGLDSDTVRNFFGGTHYGGGSAAGIHMEKGVGGGFVSVDNPAILRCAKKIIEEQGAAVPEALSEF